MGVSAALREEELTVEPGTEAVTELTVRNTGTVVDEFQIEVLGDPAGWTRVDPPSVSLLPDGEEAVTVTVRPPREWRIRAGTVPLALHVLPREDPDGASVEEIPLEIVPFTELGGDLSPRTARAGRWARYRVAIDNLGNDTAEMVLTASDPDDLLEFRWGGPSLLVEPGTAEFVPLRVRARKRRLTGRATVLPFSVVAEPAIGDVVHLDGALEQHPWIPRWLLRSLIFALIALIALLVLWFAIVRPTLESTAREAVAREVAAAQEAAAVAAEEAGSAEGAAEAAGSAAESAAQMAAQEEAAAEPPADAGAGEGAGDGAANAAIALRPAFVGDPFDFRLGEPVTPGTAAVSTFVVPEDQTLSLTDIVLQNPQGDLGVLQVRRGEAVLLEVRLENFRDLDYHFVAPIIYTGDQAVALRVVCENPPDQPCNAAAYFAGYLLVPPTEEPTPPATEEP